MSSRPVSDFIYDRTEMLLQPEVALARAREAGDLLWSRPMRRWIVLGKDVASEALRNPAFEVYDALGAFDGLMTRVGVDLSPLKRICDWIPFLTDGPRHAPLREVFARLLAEVRTPYLATFATASQELLDKLGQQGGGDFAQDYADRLHVEALGRVIGLAEADRRWITTMSSSHGSIDFAASVGEMIGASDRARQLLARLEVLTAGLPFMDQLGTHLATVGLADTHQNRLECLASLLLLGRDTIAGTLTLGLAHLLDTAGGPFDPASLGEGAAITDEFIRLSSTVQISIRVARSDQMLAGQLIAAGESLMIFLPAGNRDPAAFGCPNGMSSQNPAHVAFGAGRHLCVGMPLSRQVVALVLEQLQRFSTIASGGAREFDKSRNTRKYKTLPVLLRVRHDP